MTLLLILLTILLAVAGWYVFESRWDRGLFPVGGGKVSRNIRPGEAAALLREDTTVQVLDVRSTREFAGGALRGAVNVSISNPAFRELVGTLDVKKPILVYCAGGYRSRKAVAILQALGFTLIHHLHRGIYSWKMQGLPIAPTTKPRISP